MVKYEWDKNKNISNGKKHGISFETASGIFSNNDNCTFQDTRKDYGEPRFNTVGKLLASLFSVIWTPRADRKRIISARRANSKERGQYV